MHGATMKKAENFLTNFSEIWFR